MWVIREHFSFAKSIVETCVSRAEKFISVENLYLGRVLEKPVSRRTGEMDHYDVM